MTLSEIKGKERILQGFQVGEIGVDVTDLCNNEVMVSFLKLPAYITDYEIKSKLQLWGVTQVTPIKRRYVARNKCGGRDSIRQS